MAGLHSSSIVTMYDSCFSVGMETENMIAIPEIPSDLVSYPGFGTEWNGDVGVKPSSFPLSEH